MHVLQGNGSTAAPFMLWKAPDLLSRSSIFVLQRFVRVLLLFFLVCLECETGSFGAFLSLSGTTIHRFGANHLGSFCYYLS